MSKSNLFENDLLGLIFNGTAISSIADNTATAPLTNLYVALHTADPGEARTAGGWTITGNSVSPVAAIEFGEMSGGTGGTVTHASIGTSSTGTGKILYSGALTPNITVSLGVLPRIKNTSTITED
jgi:hypothetical protein